MNKENNIRKRKLKITLVLATMFILLTSAFLFLRAYFLDNQPGSTSDTFISSILKNNPIVLNFFNNSTSSNQSISFGKNLKSPFTVNPTSNQIWLEIATTTNKIVGYLDTENVFTRVYVLSSDAKYSLYQDKTIVYIDRNPFTAIYSLFSQSIGNYPQEVFRLNYGESLKNFFFNTEDYSFYIIYSNADGKNFVASITETNEIVNLFETYGGVDQYSEIMNVAKGIVYITSDTTCSSLNLFDKALQTVSCRDIVKNDSKKVFIEASSFAITGLAQNTTQLTELDQSLNKSRTVLDSEGKKVFNLIEYFDPYIVYLKYNVNSSSQLVPESIDYVDSVTLESKTITNTFPEGKVQGLLYLDNRLIISFLNNDLKNVLLEYQVNPISYTGSMPVSLPYTSSWKEIDLGLSGIVGIKVMDQEYML